MIQVSFHRDLYSEEALAEAIDLYREHANIERESREDAFLVRITSTAQFDEREIADELGNYVLGATIDRQHSSSAPR
jgi:hypothetical protein